MKYLKYFESNDYLLFEEIDINNPSDRYSKVIESKLQNWTEDDISKVKRIMEMNGDKWSPGGKFVENPIPGKHRRFEVKISEPNPFYLDIIYYFPFPSFSSSPERYTRVKIKQFEDDWFIYATSPTKSSSSKSYLIDGWDGLQEVINKIYM